MKLISVQLIVKYDCKSIILINTTIHKQDINKALRVLKNFSVLFLFQVYILIKYFSNKKNN